MNGFGMQRWMTLGLTVLLGLVVLGTTALAGEAGPCGAPCAVPKPDCECYTCECPKPAKATCPPKYLNLRFQENWDPCLCVSPCDRPDWSDRLKARSFGACNRIWASVGGQVRVRYEGWNNQLFGAAGRAADDSWGLLRLRAHADVHFGSIFRVFIEGIWADQWTRELGPRAIDRNRGDLLNAFAEVAGNLGGVDGLLRLGRTELQEGRQRLISPLDWANTRRTFDGISGSLSRGTHKLDVFAVRPVLVDASGGDDWFSDQSAEAFWGLYYSKKHLTCLAWEAYVLGLHRDDARYRGVTDQEDRYTAGGRIFGKLPQTRLDYDIEVAAQFGTFGDEDIFAGMLALDLGYRPCWTSWNERLGVGFDYASGSDDSGTVGTFNQLYPLGHAYLGFIDLLGRQNVVAGRLSASVEPTKSLTLKADYHGFWRANKEDAAYNVGGGILRAPTVDDLFIGTELDLYFIWKLDRHWRVTGGYCHFFTGEFIQDTGPSKDVDFFWLDAQVTF